MAERIAVAEVFKSHQSECYQYRGSDGYPTADVFSPVAVRTVDGREFVLPQGKQAWSEENDVFWYARYDTDVMIEKIKKRGSIDPDNWIFIEPDDRSLEDMAYDDWVREQEDRMYGDGW